MEPRWTRFGLLIVCCLLVPSHAVLAACGCTGMSVTWGGAVDICSDNNVQFGECQRAAGGVGTVCPNNTYVFNCPTGVNDQHWAAAIDPYQRTGFRVVATYAANSTAADCTPGQILQETITSGGQQAANPPINPTSLGGNQTIGGLDLRINNNGLQTFPRVGQTYANTGRPFFGGDNYVGGAGGVVSSQSDTGSQWWDNTDQTKDNQAEVAIWSYRFLAFVQGSQGQPSCSCAFDINVDWAANMNPVTARAAVAAGTENCP